MNLERCLLLGQGMRRIGERNEIFLHLCAVVLSVHDSGFSETKVEVEIDLGRS